MKSRVARYKWVSSRPSVSYDLAVRPLDLAMGIVMEVGLC